MFRVAHCAIEVPMGNLCGKVLRCTFDAGWRDADTNDQRLCRGRVTEDGLDFPAGVLGCDDATARDAVDADFSRCDGL